VADVEVGGKNLADTLFEAEEITHISHLKKNYLDYNSVRKASNEASQRWRKIPINALIYLVD